MGKLRLGIGFGMALAISSGSWGGSQLPEMEQLLAYGERAVEQGRYEAGLAASQLILLGEIRYSLGEAPESAKAALIEAMHDWERVTMGEVRFVEVAAAEAQVTLTWANSLRKSGAEVGGYARWKRSVRRDQSGTLRPDVSAQIELRLRLPDGRAMNREQLKQCALHELGHVLGLDDSQTKSDVMSPLDPARPITQPSPNDIKALTELRARAWRLQMSASMLLLP